MNFCIQSSSLKQEIPIFSSVTSLENKYNQKDEEERSLTESEDESNAEMFAFSFDSDIQDAIPLFKHKVKSIPKNISSSLDSRGVPRRLCLVCNDFASGLHYGIPSCEACKAFFKRSVQGNVDYSCSGTEDCEITKGRRKACQACRFKKCLAVGMLKEGVRMDRVRGGRQKYRRIESSSTSLLNNHQLKLSIEHKLTIETLNSIEPPKIFSFPLDSILDPCLRFKQALCDLADREVISFITWARMLPGFQNLKFQDRIVLIQSSWLLIFIFNIALKTINNNNPNSNNNFKNNSCENFRMDLVFAEDLILKSIEEYWMPRDLTRELDYFCYKVKKLSLACPEVLLLKAILFFDSEVSDLKELEEVDQAKNKLQDYLFEFELSNGETDTSRFCKLISLLNCFDSLKDSFLNYFYSIKNENVVHMNKLLFELVSLYEREDEERKKEDVKKIKTEEKREAENKKEETRPSSPTFIDQVNICANIGSNEVKFDDSNDNLNKENDNGIEITDNFTELFLNMSSPPFSSQVPSIEIINNFS